MVTGVTMAVMSAGDDDKKPATSNVDVSRHFADHRVTDLLTGPIGPGETMKTGVYLPRGARMIDIVGAGGFEILSSNHKDGDSRTWLEITFRNDTPAPMRFVGFVAYDVNPQGTP